MLNEQLPLHGRPAVREAAEEAIGGFALLLPS